MRRTASPFDAALLAAAGVLFVVVFAVTSRRGARSEPRASLPTGARQRVVDAAAAEVGQCDGSKYWVDLGLPGAVQEWCGVFALWAIKRAGFASTIPWELGRGFCYRLPTTREPRPGDVAYFEALQHHALVESVTPTHVTTIDGNGPCVHRTTRARSQVTAFFDIQPLIDGRANVLA